MYGILLSIFVLFNCVALNQRLQYRQVVSRHRSPGHLFEGRPGVASQFVSRRPRRAAA
ncbi:MAG: hypothetical protein OEW29_13885 [Acidimicrobiia bacterium]|nr:hypothetical protein [Acidimicrobiia bacterium]MDH4365167.1 hypothetical protein [Acidimicrobiia bacterium]